ncbi:MAG: RnfABCDGE type electron transport complex subunit D [Candidatus Neomarinimicrobiota bacterium]
MEEQIQNPNPAEPKPIVAKPVGDSQKSADKRLLIVSPAPHTIKGNDVPQIMWTVILALMPAAIFGIYNFGWRALTVMLVSVVTTISTEAISNLMRRKAITVGDGSAVLTGLLLAMTLPPGLPLSMVVIGSAFSIFIGKQIFGGLGYNIFNPALLGRAFLQTSFPIAMTTWTIPKTIDAITSATPLGSFKFEKTLTPYFDLFMGNVGGCIGETSALLILIGGLYLIVRKYADWRIPVSYLGSVLIMGGIFWLIDPTKYPDPVFHLFSGGLMLGAFFMATDMVTSPVTTRGTWIFGAGAGILLVIIRLFGGLPEGVMYSILLMNSLVPLINRYTRPKYFGEVKS